LLLVGREANQKTGLLIAALYDGRLTYAQFAAERMKNTDQMMASLTGGSTATTEPSLPTVSKTTFARAEEIRLQRRGGSYLVPVAVNGLPPMPFVLDSGAEIVALPAEVVLTLWRTGTLAVR
jgi:hypothetical protein